MIAANTYGCACPSLYTGTRCETSILGKLLPFDATAAVTMFILVATHPCVIRPTVVCKNGGTCAVNGANFLCKCPVGWSGNNCEIQDGMSFLSVSFRRGKVVRKRLKVDGLTMNGGPSFSSSIHSHEHMHSESLRSLRYLPASGPTNRSYRSVQLYRSMDRQIVRCEHGW